NVTGVQTCALPILVNVPAFSQISSKFTGWLCQFCLLGQREYSSFYRSQTGIQAQYCTGIDTTLGVWGLVFGVCINEEGHQRACQSPRWFDHIWRVSFAGGLVEVLHLGARALGVILEVKISQVGDAHALSPVS